VIGIYLICLCAGLGALLAGTLVWAVLQMTVALSPALEPTIGLPSVIAGVFLLAFTVHAVFLFRLKRRILCRARSCGNLIFSQKSIASSAGLLAGIWLLKKLLRR
jgi:hypothetical protein